MTARLTLALLFLGFALQGLALYLMNHPVICTCGYVKLWHGQVFHSENSQHIADWYSLGHLDHGILFYGAAWLLARNWGFNARALAVGVTGVIWEVGENTNMVIERFRTVTISLDYYGDSVLNSVWDSVIMMAGVVLARRVPVWVSVAVVLGTETLTTWMVRDGLALNTLMLLYPVQAVKDWQMALWLH